MGCALIYGRNRGGQIDRKFCEMSDWYALLPERPVSALGNAGLSVVMAEIIIR